MQIITIGYTDYTFDNDNKVIELFKALKGIKKVETRYPNKNEAGETLYDQGVQELIPVSYSISVKE